MICPSCGSRQVGYLPGNRFYCWGCFVQFVIGDTRIEVYEVDEDGTLVSVNRAVPEAMTATPGR